MFSQESYEDSLIRLIKSGKPDTLMVERLDRLSRRLRDSNVDTSIILSNQALEISHRLGYRKGVALSYAKLGSYYFYKSDYGRSSSYHFKALAIYEDLAAKATGETRRKLRTLVSHELNGIALAYDDMGNKRKALEYLEKGIKIDLENDDKKSLAGKYNNMGGLLDVLENSEKALEYFKKALAINEEVGNEGWIAVNTMNIGNIEEKRGNYDKAEKLYLKALDINKRLGKKLQISLTYSNLASVYFKMKQIKKSEELMKKSFDLSKEIDDLTGVEFASKNLYEVYKELNKPELALKYFEEYRAARDSIVNEEKNEELLRNEMNYEFQIENAQKKAEQDKKDALTNAEQRRQSVIIACVISGMIILFVFLVFIVRSLFITRRQKNLIEAKNKETQLQKEVIELQHKDILDSIKYAKRIQQSLLPTDRYIEKQLVKKKN